MRRLILAIALVATPAAAQDAGLGTWWRNSFGFTMPSTVRPEAYSLDLAARGIGCQTAARQPEWAMAEMLGRVTVQRWIDTNRLPGQAIGTWQDDMDSAHNNGPQRFLACQIANRGVERDTAFYITHGARSFPTRAKQLIDALPTAGGADEATIRARVDAEWRARLRAL